MVTLKELIDNQKWNNMTDIQIIKAFFEFNDLEENGIDIITDLTKSKITKVKNKYSMAESWIRMLPTKYLYEHYDLDTADNLHMLELDFLMNGGELSNSYFEWAKEYIPNIEAPKAYFNPLINWLKKKNIKFRETREI